MTSVTASSGSRAPLRGIAAVLMVTLCFLVLAATPARADCGVLDATCVVETVVDTTDEVVETVEGPVDEVVDTVEGTVDEVVETVDEVVETVEGTVDEVVETVDGTVDEVVETVEDTVRTVTDPVEDTIGPIAPDPGLDPTVPETPGVNDPPSDENPNQGVESTVVRPDARVSVGTLGGSAPTIGSGPLGPAGFVSASPASPQGLFGPFAGPAAELAQRLAFPVALIVLVFVFVAVQNRLDRRDPKLALAATAPDVLAFA